MSFQKNPGSRVAIRGRHICSGTWHSIPHHDIETVDYCVEGGGLNCNRKKIYPTDRMLDLAIRHHPQSESLLVIA
jgi:hypothetical protein